MSFKLLDAKPCRTILKLHQKVSFGPEACEIGPKVVIWGIRRTGFPPEDSPLYYRGSICTSFCCYYVHVGFSCVLVLDASVNKVYVEGSSLSLLKGV